MNNKIKAILIFVPWVALLLLTITLTVQTFTTKEVTISIKGYDPLDLLSGHYISYQIDWDKTDCSQFYDKKCPIQHFKQYREKARWGDRYRFYVPEENAKELESLLRSGNKNFQIVYSYSVNTVPLPKRLLIDGKEWREVLKKQE